MGLRCLIYRHPGVLGAAARWREDTKKVLACVGVILFGSPLNAFRVLLASASCLGDVCEPHTLIVDHGRGSIDTARYVQFDIAAANARDIRCNLPLSDTQYLRFALAD